MRFFRIFRRDTPQTAVENGLKQAERELFNARLAEHTARSHISYWQSRTDLLLALQAEQLSKPVSPQPGSSAPIELG